MATPHNLAEAGQIAPDVLMPGDPKRAARIAEVFLDDAQLLSDVRGIPCYTGTHNGRPLSVMASGMGLPSISIYATELYRFYGVKRIVRVGTCGVWSDEIALKEIVVAAAVHTDSSISQQLAPGANLSLVPSFGLLSSAVSGAEAAERRVHVGAVYSSDWFYGHHPEFEQRLRDLGALAVEMESAGLYSTAMVERAEALTLLTATDHLGTTEQRLTPDEREECFLEMVELAVAALG